MSPASGPQKDLEAVLDHALGEAGVAHGDGIVAAVSGGLDSMVLLDLLHRTRAPRRLHLHVAHLDHRLRAESAEDARFVAAAAEGLGLPVTVEAVDVAGEARRSGRSLEEEGREARYALFERVRRQSGCRWVAVAHHADDQAETLLLRLLRGAGSTGLGAMSPVRAPGVLRPLLSASRAQIRDHACREDIEFREDPGNRDLAVPRNRVRHELLPSLRRRHNPAVVDVLSRTASLLRDEDDYLDGVARKAARQALVRRDPEGVTLDAGRLLGYHRAVRRRVLRQYIQELAQHAPVSRAAVEAASEAAATGSGLRSVAGGLWVQGTGASLILRRGPACRVHARVELPGRTQVPERRVTLEARFLDPARFDEVRPSLDGWRAAFDAGAAEGELSLRSPRPGDRLQPLGMKGRHKKLSDCFIDAKWPRILRPEALLLTRRPPTPDAEEEILWVAGLARSHRHRVAAGSRRILYLEFES